MKFVAHFWPVIEPYTPLVRGWAMDAIADHLEAVARGDIIRLLANVPPGSSKSTLCSVFLPLWIWTALDRPGERFLLLSYSSALPERDNRKKLAIMASPEFKRLYGNRFVLTKQGEELIENAKTGFVQAAGILGTVTGRRADIVILDDPNNVADIESERIRESTSINFREAVSNRLNDMERSAIIVIQQRSHEGDISGIILDEGFPYVHLCIPALYEEGRHCTTSIGWSDPRSQIDESFWPERFPNEVLDALSLEIGEFGFAGQYCQRPEPRGGGILKREYWQHWGEKKFPELDFVLASLDPAFTSKQENDPSGFTVWGAFLTDTGHRALILLHAFRKRLELCGPDTTKHFTETYKDFKRRTEHKWGLVENIHDCCLRFHVDHLIVESKGPGHSVVQAMARLFPNPSYTVQLIDPKRLDKTARAIRVQPEFSAGQVWAPTDRAWADMVISECAVAPRGRTDDLFDSTSMAVFWLRSNGFLERREEQFTKREEALKKYKSPSPLYPI